jgi:hypothetical protein
MKRRRRFDDSSELIKDSLPSIETTWGDMDRVPHRYSMGWAR